MGVRFLAPEVRGQNVAGAGAFLSVNSDARSSQADLFSPLL